MGLERFRDEALRADDKRGVKDEPHNGWLGNVCEWGGGSGGILTGLSRKTSVGHKGPMLLRASLVFLSLISRQSVLGQNMGKSALVTMVTAIKTAR